MDIIGNILITFFAVFGILLVVGVVLFLYTVKKMIDIAHQCEQCREK